MKKVTVVIPFLNEEENLRNFPERMLDLQSRLPAYDVEFMFVDDGSTDDSFGIVSSFDQANRTLIRFSRNYGSHYALFAAIDECDTDYLTFMSADMQEPLQLYVQFLEHLESTKDDMVFAKRRIRNTDRTNQFFSKVYNGMVKKFAFSDFPENGADVFMVKRNVIDTLKQIDEKNTSIYGVLFTIGFKKGFVEYDQLSRAKGQSKWTFQKKVKMLVDTFVAFTLLPLRIITYIGITFSTVGLLYGLFIILNAFTGFIEVQGWATVVALLTFGFGVTFLMIGLISEYLWRMFDQIRPRPRYIIKDKIARYVEKDLG